MVSLPIRSGLGRGRDESAPTATATAFLFIFLSPEVFPYEEHRS